MLTDIGEFLSDIQSINTTDKTGFVLFCSTSQSAFSIQHQLLHDFDIPAILDIDTYGTHYIIPLGDLDDKITLNFIQRGWEWDRNQNFIQYVITLYNEDATNKIYNILIAYGYNVVLSPNNMQLIVKCIADSPRNIDMQQFKYGFETFEKTSPKSMDNYFNKILFNGIIENTEYRKIRKQDFDINTIKQNKDLIIREILYQYFNKRIRTHLGWVTFPKKFDANKLDSGTIRNINLIRDFLYSVAERYIDTQIEKATETKQRTVIRFDYLKTCNEYNNFRNILKLAQNWQRARNKNNRIEKRNIRMSQRWTYKLMDLNDGYYIVHLGAQEALDYENRTLKHPSEIYYNDDIYEGILRYSIRKGYTPVLTLIVNNDKVVKCYGYKNTVPCDSDLRNAVRNFMRERNLTIPDNSWNKLIAYIKQNGTVYDVFDLPKDFISNNTLNLAEMGLDKLPNMSTVTVNGNFSGYKNNLPNLYGAPRKVLGDCDFSQNPLESLYGMPREIGGLVLLSGHKLTAESFVPLYIENKLKKNDILGIDKKTATAWQDQITQRKIGLANIISSLYEIKNKYSR